jgi:hypothetical protein
MAFMGGKRLMHLIDEFNSPILLKTSFEVI